MEGCIGDYEPTSLLKEYHIHLNAQPKEDQENPSIIQIILISKKLTMNHNQIILTMKRFTFPTNKHNLNQSSSYFKDNKRIPYTHPKTKRINKSQFYDINNSIIPISQGLYTHNPKTTNIK